MRNNLIICCAPILDSFTDKIKNRLIEILVERNENVEVRELYKLNFNSVISEKDILSASKGEFAPDVLEEQRYIQNADNVILVFPLYQSAMPALIKGDVDRVFAQNFAYSYNKDRSIKKLMEGKTLSIFSPMGSLEYYEKNSFKEALDHNLQYCFIIRGFEVSGIHYFDYANRDKLFLELENKI